MGVRVLGKHLVGERGAGEEHGIAVRFRRRLAAGVRAPAVANNENHWFLRHASRCNGSPADGQGGIEPTPNVSSTYDAVYGRLAL